MTPRNTFLLLGALALLGRPAGAATPITIDTSALAGQAGFLDFQLSDDGSGTTPIVPLVALDGSPLPVGTTLADTGAGNELMQPITFGNSYTYTPTFTTDPTGDEPSFLQLYLLDATQTTLPTDDPDTTDAAAVTTVDTLGNVTTQTFTPLGTAAVPEPDAWALLALGLPPLGVLAARRRRAG